MARPDFRAAAARRLSEDTELSPAIVSLLTPDSPTRSLGVRVVPVDHIDPNPLQPRVVFEAAALEELAASIREHGVLQPILVRPTGPNQYQIVAGERRWRASRLAGLRSVPALIEDIDDDTALEISIIENLQREDLTPLDEAAMYDRMIHEHGYSIRRLAEKLGKDKGYLENRLRLADAPPEIRELVSLRKDSLSHAYELMKVEDPKKRRRLTEQVARGELTLIKLREKIDGRPPRTPRGTDDVGPGSGARSGSRHGVRQIDRGRGRRAVARHQPHGRLPDEREAAPGRGHRGPRGCPSKHGYPRVHPGHGSREPGQVPDDHQAQAGERHRPRSERGLLLLDLAGDAGQTNSSQAVARIPIPTASVSQPSSRCLGVAVRPPAVAPRTAPMSTITAPRAVTTMGPGPGFAATRVPDTIAMATANRTTCTSQAHARPSREAEDAVPLALSRSGPRSRWRSPGRAPASTAHGTRTANDAGSGAPVPIQP